MKNSFARLVAQGAIACAGALLVSGAAAAATCYQVIDRNDEVIYQGVAPPIEIGAPPTSEAWNALRSNGRTLIFFTTDNCLLVTAVSKDDSGPPASIDDILSSVPDMRGARTGAGPGVSSYGGGSAMRGSGNAASDLSSVRGMARQTYMPGHYGDSAMVVPRIR